ncbi:unnamed protein product [Rotaria sordida]|uniref:Uncharacterized protein n=1 Tax=Rotaria sordida TaxID=392033 RepID=A0A813R0K2_9BILA|nr:unnamed protein product [Rotaria sordida]CAF3940690.1 unnamed protein product [Rotaria sordida]
MHEKSTKKTIPDKRLTKKQESIKNKLSSGIIIGIILTIITIILQSIALFTPHWKEIAPNTQSLYVDGVDALIRKEVLHYFNSVHRYSRHSYGLFQRCEYVLNNSSIYNNQNDLDDFVVNKQRNKCTKNFLPRYNDNYFNECHSLQYYRFCTKASVKNFDINNDYLHATFDISTSPINVDSKMSCDCHYPPYVLVCQIIGILALICLLLTCLLFILFPFFTNVHYRLKIKYFGILSSLLSIVLLTINLIIIYKHLEYESIAYLLDIEKHYKSTQIYKLSEDTKIAIDRFLSTINVRIGYSTIIAWIAFGLSIIDGILLLTTCQIKHHYNEKEICISLMSSPENEQHYATHQFTSVPNDSQTLSPPMSVNNNRNEFTSLPPISQHEKYPPQPKFTEHEV